MARKVQYVYEFSPIDRYRYTHHTDKGKVLSFVVQYETKIGDKWHPVVRYDTAHGFVHRDLLHFGKKQEKIFIKVADFNEGLTKAVEDIKENWVTYKNAFVKEIEEHESK